MRSLKQGFVRDSKNSRRTRESGVSSTERLAMTGRERTQLAVAHRQPDRVPFDLGGMAQSGIHRLAYANLRRHLGLPEGAVRTQNIITQAAIIDDDIRDRLGIDTYFIHGKWADPAAASVRVEGKYFVYEDEWGVGRRMPREGGLYYDIYKHPFDSDHWKTMLEDYQWPDPLAGHRFEGLAEEAKQAQAKGLFVVLMGLCPGIMEMATWLCGFERFFLDLALQPEVCQFFLNRIGELKLAYWPRAFELAGDHIDAVNEADDLAGQDSLLMSANMYRQVVKPHHQRLFCAIRQAAPKVKIIFHTCGAVREIIPDLIEIGVDVLNPIQTSARDMDAKELKDEFGKDLCFWGGGIDTQHVLLEGTAQQITDHVRSNIKTFGPGGGFVFGPTHVYQADVPPENFMVVWNTVQKYGQRVPRIRPR